MMNKKDGCSSTAIHFSILKIGNTNNDKEQELFTAMKAMLEYSDKKGFDSTYTFGTDCFENVWEMMIDRAFGIKENFENIGEAVGDWKYSVNNSQMKNYERIQGVLMDTRYLMNNYTEITEQQKKIFSECVEKVLQRNPILSQKN